MGEYGGEYVPWILPQIGYQKSREMLCHKRCRSHRRCISWHCPPGDLPEQREKSLLLVTMALLPDTHPIVFPYFQTKWPAFHGHGATDATFSAFPSNVVIITTKNYSDRRTINGLCRPSHLLVPLSCLSSCSRNLKLLGSFE